MRKRPDNKSGMPAIVADYDRLSHLYTVHCQINRATTSIGSDDEMLQTICAILTGSGLFSLVWVGVHDASRRVLVPVASSIDYPETVSGLAVPTGGDAQIRGPAGIAFAEERPYFCNDILTDPSTATWRERVRRHGFRAAAALPFKRRGKVTGTINVYASTANFFQEEESRLLLDAAGDVTLALENLDREHDRRAAEEAAQVERKFANSIIESMPGVMYLYTRDGRFLRWNSNLEAVSGYTGEQISRMKPDEFFAPEHRALLERRIARVFSEGSAEFEAPFLSISGQTTPYYFTGRRISYGGEACLVGVGVDVSERVHAEMILRDLNHALGMKVSERTSELEKALDRAESADRTKSAFLATMSHELRTPLNTILGFTGVILQGLAGPLTDEQKKQLGMVRGSARHLLELINDVLDISKIEAGQIETQFRLFDLAQSLAGTASSVTHLAQAKHLSLRLERPQAQCTIYSDQRRVEQILLNLLSNAVKFTDHGEVVVKLSVNDTPSGDAFVQVDVIDTGIGILPHDLEGLFQPFNRIQGAVSRPGTGLGLAICKRLAELLGGTIDVESEKGRGSRFSLRLPLAASSDR